MEIPEGIFVFTSDSREVGTVTAVDGEELKVALRGVDASVTMPVAAADRIETGRLLLSITAEQFQRQYLEDMSAEAQEWGASDEELVSDDHVSEEAVNVLWPKLGERTWKALHDLAHEVSESDADDIPRAMISDVVLVARALEGSDKPFPGSAGELCKTLNQHAAVLPHETSGR